MPWQTRHSSPDRSLVKMLSFIAGCPLFCSKGAVSAVSVGSFHIAPTSLATPKTSPRQNIIRANLKAAKNVLCQKFGTLPVPSSDLPSAVAVSPIAVSEAETGCAVPVAMFPHTAANRTNPNAMTKMVAVFIWLIFLF